MLLIELRKILWIQSNMRKVIEVINLSKEYKLGAVGRGTLYRDLQSLWARIRNKDDPNSIIGKSDTSSFEKKGFRSSNF